MFSNLYQINKACGLSVHQDANGFAMDICIAASGGGAVNIVEHKFGLISMGQLNFISEKELPCALNLTGRHVIHKIVAKIEEWNEAQFLKLFPGTVASEFYTQHFISGDKSFVSVIRRAEADRWVEEVTKKGLIVVSVSMGAFIASAITDQLNIYGNELVFDGHLIERKEDGSWINYHYEKDRQGEFPLRLDTQEVAEALILPYSGAFQILLNKYVAPVEADIPLIRERLKRLVAKRWLSGALAIVLSVAFVVLLINFFYLQHLRTENALLSEKVSKNTLNESDFEVLKNKSEKQEILLKSVGWNDKPAVAPIIDRMMQNLPDGLHLFSMEVNPINSDSSRVSQVLVFRPEVMMIKGSSPTILPVNEWVARLNVIKGVRRASLESYDYNREMSTGIFTIVIAY